MAVSIFQIVVQDVVGSNPTSRPNKINGLAKLKKQSVWNDSYFDSLKSQRIARTIMFIGSSFFLSILQATYTKHQNITRFFRVYVFAVVF
jgi:hypothetical protein